MIPSDHFVRFYNEVFKALEKRGRRHLVAYWAELGRLQTVELSERLRTGGLPAAYDYWKRIFKEENCKGAIRLTRDFFEGRMDRCPSLSKVLDNDASASPTYCDHCMAWMEPVMKAAGLHAVMDLKSRTEPRCVFRVYKDRAKADAFERTTTLPSHPYGKHGRNNARRRTRIGKRSIRLGGRFDTP